MMRIIQCLFLMPLVLLPLKTSEAATPTSGQIVVTGNVIVGTCNFSGSSNISIPLGDVSLSDFNGVGSTIADKDFTIDLNCQNQANVYLTMNATAVSGLDSSGVIALQGNGSASGVGIQLLKNGVAFPLNIQQQIALQQSSALTINMSARYYQSSAVMTPGTGNATVNFVVDYL